MPDGLVAKRRQPLSLTTPPPTAFQTNRRVEFSDLDSAAHVNNAYYATYVEQALWDALAAHGWVINPFEREVRLRRRRLDLQYEEPARYGEQLDTVVCSADVGADGFNAACVIRRATVAVTSRLVRTGIGRVTAFALRFEKRSSR